MSLSAIKHLILSLVGLMALAGMSMGAKKPVGADADRLKASYAFFEAENRLRNEDAGTAYYLYRRAAQLDPSDVDIAAALGELTIVSGMGDSTEFEEAYQALKRCFFNNPKDYHSGLRYARVAEQLLRFEDVRDIYAELCRVYPDRPDYSLQYAWFKALGYRKGDTAALGEAQAIYDRIEAGTGVDMNLTLHRVRTLSLANDTAGMVEQIRRYHATAPLDAEVNFYTGNIFDYIGLPDSAIVYYDLACRLDSTMGEAYLARAEHYLAAGDSARYDIEVTHALESPSLEFDPKFEILTNYTRALFEDSSRHAMLTSLFARMLDIHPGEARLHGLYGAFLATIKKPAEAAEQFGYASDLDPEDEDFWRYKMSSLLEAGDTVAAIATAGEAAKRFDNVYYPVFGASLLTVGKEYDRAIAMLDSFDISNQENREALSAFYQTRGDVLYAMERTDSALAAYEKAIDHNPANAGALNNAAYYMSVDGRELDKAQNYVERALMVEPLNPTFIDTYAWVLFKKGDYENARIQIDAVLNIYSDSTDILPATDTVCAVEDTIQVVEDVEEVVEVEEVTDEMQEEASADVYDHAGDIYFMVGEPEKALEFWKQALMLAPDDKKIQEKVKKKKIPAPTPPKEDAP